MLQVLLVLGGLAVHLFIECIGAVSRLLFENWIYCPDRPAVKAFLLFLGPFRVSVLPISPIGATRFFALGISGLDRILGCYVNLTSRFWSMQLTPEAIASWAAVIWRFQWAVSLCPFTHFCILLQFFLLPFVNQEIRQPADYC